MSEETRQPPAVIEIKEARSLLFARRARPSDRAREIAVAQFHRRPDRSSAVGPSCFNAVLALRLSRRDSPNV
jgi:hypothetical protein